MKRTIPLAVAFGMILFSHIAAAKDPSSPQCLEIPDSFDSWRLLSITENPDQVERRFEHPRLSNCQAITVALLNECREYLVVKTVLVLDEKNMVRESRAILRMADDIWKEGVGVEVRLGEYVKTKERTAIFILDTDPPSNPPITREVSIPYPCINVFPSE